MWWIAVEGACEVVGMRLAICGQERTVWGLEDPGSSVNILSV